MLQRFFHAQHGRDTAIGIGKTRGPFGLRGGPEQRSQFVANGACLFAAHALALVVRMMVGGMWPGWSVLLAPVFEAALWPLASLLLLAPQRRAPDRDAHRPL